MRHSIVLPVTWAIALFAATAFGDSLPMVELEAGDKTYRGKPIANSDEVCWLIDPSGRLEEISLPSVTSFRRVSKEFRGLSAKEMRAKLLKEFGKGYEVAGTGHYQVCAARGRAKEYSRVFDQLFRAFYSHFSVRNFRLQKPEFPLTAVVFPDRTRFLEYCRQDGIGPSKTLLGYYMRITNRVALFDSGRESVTTLSDVSRNVGVRFGGDVIPFESAIQPFPQFWGARQQTLTRGNQSGSINGALRDTMIHEATHQMAFNTGLHSRVGDTPLWVVEGMATVFEAPGIRERADKKDIKSRINLNRYIHFGNYAKTRRKADSLWTFVASDDLFQKATLDAYSESWALTFFLMQTRSSRYAKYLKTMADRDPLQSYSSQERVADFQAAFGDDLHRLEIKFLRYLERLQKKAGSSAFHDSVRETVSGSTRSARSGCGVTGVRSSPGCGA